MPEHTHKGRFEAQLEEMLAAIGTRDGKDSIPLLHKRLRALTTEATYREAVLQIIAEQGKLNKFVFFRTNPKLLIPYLFRIRRSKS